jgi:hypothetical protein
MPVDHVERAVDLAGRLGQLGTDRAGQGGEVAVMAGGGVDPVRPAGAGAGEDAVPFSQVVLAGLAVLVLLIYAGIALPPSCLIAVAKRRLARVSGLSQVPLTRRP